MTEEATRAIQEILLGRCDGGLADIHKAILKRIEEGSAILAWRITIGELVVRQDDITLDEAAALEDVTGQQWSALNPVTSIAAFRAVALVCGQSRLGWDEAAAEAALPKTATAAQDCVDLVEVAPVPLDDSDEPETTSSEQPAVSDGPEK